MGRVSFYREFFLAIAVICYLVHSPISVAIEKAEYYEEQHPEGNIPYSKLLTVIRAVIILQSAFALEEVACTFFERERERIPDPEPLLLLKRFVRKYFARNVRVTGVMCCRLFLEDWFGKGRDGVAKGGSGTAFLVVFVVLFTCQTVVSTIAPPE